jgi:hypothetical protein
MDKETEQLKERAVNFCLLHSNLLALVNVTELKTTEAYSSLDNYNISTNIQDGQLINQYKDILQTM